MTKFEEELNKKMDLKEVPMYFTQSGCSMTRKTYIETNWIFDNYKNWHSDEEFQELFDKYSNLNDNYEEEVIRSSKLESQIIGLKSQLQQQALPVVPECVGNFLSGKSIFKIANGDIPDDVISWVQEQTYYVDLEKIISHLISIKVTGFTVEKPQLFKLIFPNSTAVLQKNGELDSFADTVYKRYLIENAMTEQEIKSIDERYWQFAVPVEDRE